MMSVFFRFPHNLNRLFNNCKVILILDEFFSKHEGIGGGVKVKLTPSSPPPRKTTLKKPSLIRVKYMWERVSLYVFPLC